MKKGMHARRPLGAFALATALALAIGAPAAAFADDAPAVSDPADIAATGAATTTNVTGTIKATTLKVTVPTKVAFYIDPGVESSAAAGAGGTKIGQFTNPSGFTVTNWSAVDVHCYVSKVESGSVTLVSSKGANDANLTKPGGVAPSSAKKSQIAVMVGIGGATEALDFGDASDWMTESVGDAKDTRYYAFNKTEHGKLDASTAAPDTAGEAVEMTVRGAVHKGGWAEGESFLVQPTFKVTTTDPSTE